MKRTSFIAAFINNAATAILTDPNVTSEKVFKAAEHYADLAAERGIIEDEIDRNKVVDDIMAQIPAIVSKTENSSTTPSSSSSLSSPTKRRPSSLTP